MGTPEFSVPTLEKLNTEFGVDCVVTVPDKPRGRGRKMIPSAVKARALELGLRILQPESLKDEDFVNEIKKTEPDIIAVVAFRILPPEVYQQARLGAFNIHASLLPKYRGAAPINWAIINGEKSTGLTSFLLERKVDTGRILMQHAFDIPENATAGDLHDMMMPMAADMAADTVRMLASGDYAAMPQDDSTATPAPKIFREHCEIKWGGHAMNVGHLINGVSPVPGAWTMLDGNIVKILRCEPCSCGRGEAGSFAIEGDRMIVYCGKGMIEVKEIQPSGKRPMAARDFIRGWRGPMQGRFETAE